MRKVLKHSNHKTCNSTDTNRTVCGRRDGESRKCIRKSSLCRRSRTSNDFPRSFGKQATSAREDSGLHEGRRLNCNGCWDADHSLDFIVIHILSPVTSSCPAKTEGGTSAAMPEPRIARQSDVENLPYLTAVVQESYRISYGSSSRLQRPAPDEVLLYNGGIRSWVIPKSACVTILKVQSLPY